MQAWFGAAGVCINEEGQLLMVLQGTPEEKKTWSRPWGTKEENETFEECCIREFEDETGYKVEIIQKLQVKRGCIAELNTTVEVHYYLVSIIGGTEMIQDPDNLIYEIAWKSADEIRNLKLSFPEDRDFLIGNITAQDQPCV